MPLATGGEACSSHRDAIVSSSAHQLRLDRERDDALATIDTIRADCDALIASSADSNNDDEHDPEGATLAFERAQLTSLLEDARSKLACIEEALAKSREGRYGTCERCGGPIGEERLLALPATGSCFSCASPRDSTL